MRTICILLVLALATSVRADAVAEKLQLADGLYARQMYELSAREYAAILAAQPDHPEQDAILFRMGESYRQTGRRAEADKAYRTVFKDFPASPFRARAGFRRADLFMQTGAYDGAVGLFRELLDINPPPELAASGLYFLAEACFKTDQPKEADTALRTLIKQHPTSEYAAYAKLKLADLARANEATRKQALALYQDVSKQAPTPRVAAEALFQIAELHFRAGDYEKSSAAYAALLDRYPDDERSRQAARQAAWAAHNSGLYADALRRVETALAGGASGAGDEWLYLKANCERQITRYEAAVATYTRLITEHPTGTYTTAARYEKALTLYRTGRYKEAIAEATGLQAEGDLKKDVYWLLAESFAAEKEADRAVQYYRLLIRDFPGDDLARDATYRLAHHLQSRGEDKEASRHYRRLAQDFPDSELAPSALFASGCCLARSGSDEEAVADWARLIDAYPQAKALVEQATYHRATSEIRLGRDENADRSLRQLLKAFPKSEFVADAHYWRGMLLREAGNLSDAEKELRAALSRNPRKDLERQARYHLAVVLYEREQYKPAAELMKALLGSPAQDRFSPALLEWLADYSVTQGDLPAASKAAARLVETANEPSWKQIGHACAGRAALAAGKKADAEAAYRKALEIDVVTPVAAEAALALGDLTLAADRADVAYDYFSRAAALADAESQLSIRARAYAGLGHTAVARQEPDKAIRYFMSVAILFNDPDLVPACLSEAAALMKGQGDAAGAFKVAQELEKRYPDHPLTRQALERHPRPPAESEAP